MDGYPYMIFAGFGPNGFTGTAIMAYRDYGAGTALKNFFSPNQNRNLYCYVLNKDGSRRKNYYVNESVGIATGFLISAIHNAGLVCLTHTPNPMKFLNSMCLRPINEKPIMILPVGYASADATIPAASTNKKPLDEIMSVI